MPQPQPELVPPAASYPPMRPLRGAVRGWPWDDHPTPLATPEAARLALRPEAETSVLDPVGLRRLWWRELHLGLFFVVTVLFLYGMVRYWSSEDDPTWLQALLLLLLLLNVGTVYLSVSITRAVPAPGFAPRRPVARWRWYLRMRREPVEVSPPAAWPPGSEAYAVLSGVASVQSVASGWLAQQVGLPPDVAAPWIRLLLSQGWLSGGRRVLGLGFLPEYHLQATLDGRERLERERDRLIALAAR